MAHSSFDIVCEIIPDLATENLEKSLSGAVFEQEKEDNETKSVPGDMKKKKKKKND